MLENEGNNQESASNPDAGTENPAPAPTSAPIFAPVPTSPQVPFPVAAQVVDSPQEVQAKKNKKIIIIVVICCAVVLLLCCSCAIVSAVVVSSDEKTKTDVSSTADDSAQDDLVTGEEDGLENSAVEDGSNVSESSTFLVDDGSGSKVPLKVYGKDKAAFGVMKIGDTVESDKIKMTVTWVGESEIVPGKKVYSAKVEVTNKSNSPMPIVWQDNWGGMGSDGSSLEYDYTIANTSNENPLDDLNPNQTRSGTLSFSSEPETVFFTPEEGFVDVETFLWFRK